MTLIGLAILYGLGAGATATLLAFYRLHEARGREELPWWKLTLASAIWPFWWAFGVYCIWSEGKL